jgi:hypothetical protein
MSRPPWITVADPRCKVSVFMKPDGSAQAVVMSNNLRSAVMEIPAPPPGERIVVNRMTDGCVEVVYEQEDET